MKEGTFMRVSSTEKTSKFKFSILILAFSICCALTACGSTKISEDVISEYLYNSYFSERNMTISEISDIETSVGEVKNQVTVTCTTTASNKFANQTANWIIKFERFEGDWAGIYLEKSYTETYIESMLTEEEIAEIICPLFTDKAYLIFYDGINYGHNPDGSVQDQNSIPCAFCEDKGSYCYANLCWLDFSWDENTMNWTWDGFLHNETTAAGEEKGDILIISDISTHFERQTSSVYETFDIEEDSENPGTFWLRNYSSTFPAGWQHQPTTIQMDDCQLEFEYKDHDIVFSPFSAIIDSIKSRFLDCTFRKEGRFIGFYLIDDTLYYMSPESVQRLEKVITVPTDITTKIEEFAMEEDWIAWRGTGQI